MADIQTRKQEHIKLAQDPNSQSHDDLFTDIQLPYRALPELNLTDADTTTTLLGKKISQPLIIASMTGGSAHAETINRNLAEAVETCQVALGVGSQRVALAKPGAVDTFRLVRKYAPTAVIFANMGAVQLNYGHRIDSYRRIVDMVTADALYLHLNPLQEALQPEGDTNYSKLKEKIAALVEQIGVPVFVKEVGHGIDPQTFKDLVDMGVAGIDLAGVGGTSWAWIEGKRSGNELLTEWFKEFGIPTDRLLQNVKDIPRGKTKLVVSGGIRNPIQGLKAHTLGADYYSAAQPFLAPALDNTAAVIDLINTWQKGLQVAMFSCGIKGWD